MGLMISPGAAENAYGDTDSAGDFVSNENSRVFVNTKRGSLREEGVLEEGIDAYEREIRLVMVDSIGTRGPTANTKRKVIDVLG